MRKKIIVLVNGVDGLVAHADTLSKYRYDDVIPVHYSLGHPYSDAIAQSLNSSVVHHRMVHYCKSIPLEDDKQVSWTATPYEPLLWDSIVRLNADMVILGIIKTDKQILQNTIGWINEFNEKFGKKIVHCPLIDMDKHQVLQKGLDMGIVSDILNMYPCKCKTTSLYGCGGCTSCVRKRSALLKMGRQTNMPSCDINTTFELADFVGNILDELNDGTLTDVMQAQLDEMMPALSSDFNSENLQDIVDGLYHAAWTRVGGKPKKPEIKTEIACPNLPEDIQEPGEA